ncbi:hypothetical protein HUT06_21400 [Actinomadura sp. NAK00032]|uniref:hypothetical protein n=1 Tax=Actinomadura sp. NAK00032 TaxID=2742128 RepID=UPI0015925F64|nr:hypothetical protein [Actinomadura sp. NAK00032]QKW32614.1 hypothetical protein HUT06_21400 [Actinomadura sp. NAK00032]
MLDVLRAVQGIGGAFAFAPAMAIIAAHDTAPPARVGQPDCGLKIRAYPETEAALRNLVTAARRVRRHTTPG